MSALRAAEIHARLGPAWGAVLERAGIDPKYLRGKHSECPACGGKDRFRFTNKFNRGDYICNQCGHGSGFDLLMKVLRIDYAEARRRVVAAAGLTVQPSEPHPVAHTRLAAQSTGPAGPPSRVLQIRRTSCPVEDCQEAVNYLRGRALWPLPVPCALRAHPSLPYYQDGRQVGRFAALVADVVDVSGLLVTVHVTYLKDGSKVSEHEPRKLLSPLTGREGCVVRLIPAASDTLGVAEGIETALSASALERIPVWAALNTSLLAKFEPPPNVAQLIVYADRDEAGLGAALKLFERLQGRIRIQARKPTAPAKDYNDVLLERK